MAAFPSLHYVLNVSVLFLFLSALYLSYAGEQYQAKLTKIRFFWQEICSGENPTSVTIIPSPTDDPTGFGFTNICDSPLTVEPESNSTTIGKAQGLYARAALVEDAMLMLVNVVFVEGKYNGSTITLFGRNTITDTVRELSVVSGTGLFRFALGYALLKTVSYDSSTGNFVVEYNVTLIHNRHLACLTLDDI